MGVLVEPFVAECGCTVCGDLSGFAVRMGRQAVVAHLDVQDPGFYPQYWKEKKRKDQTPKPRKCTLFYIY